MSECVRVRVCVRTNTLLCSHMPALLQVDESQLELFLEDVHADFAVV